MTSANERYIGDGVYASLDPARMIILRTERHGPPATHTSHWIALEPEVFAELIEFAYEIGWADVVGAGMRKAWGVSDADQARDEEDKQRKRDAAEGFDD